jgi:spermidine synthase
VLGGVFAATGFSALCLQVVWQRVISLHAGVDLVSFTTIIAAFLAGLGVGNLAGGALADRLGPRRALLAFAAANVGIGLYAWVSLDLLYDLYRSNATSLDSTPAKFAFNVALLLVPTVLMGLSLPLVAKGLVERAEDAGPLVGRLYAINTIGAAAGAAVGGWLLIGSLGFTATVRVAGTLNLLAAVAVAALWRAASAAADAAPAPAPADDRQVPEGGSGRSWPWFVVYSLTGAVALGFELVFFRLIDALMRSNSYSFPHVLFLYLTLFGIGSALGARRVARVADPARTFLGLQFAVGLSALAGIVLLTRVAPAIGAERAMRSYFCCDGFNTGFGEVDTATEWAKLAFAYAIGPLFLMAVPVLLMGASFPFVQALVNQRLDTLGRRTGALLTANIAGNVAGTLLVGLVLLHHLGTAGTARLLALVLLVPGVAAAFRSRPERRVRDAAVAVVLMLVLVLAMPTNQQLWAVLHGVDADDLALVEERSCVITTKPVAEQLLLFINASSQNGYPFDDFHVLIGLTPALVHPAPDESLAIGLGIGSTPWSVALNPQVARLEAVEICGGQIEVIEDLAADGTPEMVDLVEDPRVSLLEGDGRDHLLRTDRRYDLVNVDTLRPQSAFSGSLYSVEFYELVQDRLAEGGVLAQWVASPRTLNSATEVFPYVITLPVPSYGSSFFLASDSPITFDRAQLLDRFDTLVPADAFGDEQRARLREYFATVEPTCAAAGGPTGPVPGDAVNHDLDPRDEYFLNQPSQVTTRPSC